MGPPRPSNLPPRTTSPPAPSGRDVGMHASVVAQFLLPTPSSPVRRTRLRVQKMWAAAPGFRPRRPSAACQPPQWIVPGGPTARLPLSRAPPHCGCRAAPSPPRGSLHDPQGIAHLQRPDGVRQVRDVLLDAREDRLHVGGASVLASAADSVSVVVSSFPFDTRADTPHHQEGNDVPRVRLPRSRKVTSRTDPGPSARRGSFACTRLIGTPAPDDERGDATSECVDQAAIDRLAASIEILEPSEPHASSG